MTTIRVLREQAHARRGWKAQKQPKAACFEGQFRDGWQIKGPKYVPDYEDTYFSEEDAKFIEGAPDAICRLIDTVMRQAKEITRLRRIVNTLKGSKAQ